MNMLRVTHIADGATGTQLMHLGLPVEHLCQTHPEAVLDLHNAYRLAGSRILRTNSFMLPCDCSAAARIAFEAADTDAEVWGTAGPVCGSEAEIHNLYTAHFKALADAGIKHLHIETAIDPVALDAALDAAFSIPEVEVSACAYVHPQGRTPLDADSFLRLCRDYDLKLAGLNCVPADEHTSRLLARMADEIEYVALFAQGDTLSPRDWAKAVVDTAGGVRLHVAGGCCGTGPAHIAALRACAEA